MVTQRLFYVDNYINKFSAVVLSCEKCNGGYSVVLNKTAFFPEGGGQYADTGKIGERDVLDVQERDGVIFHKVNGELLLNSEYECSVDWNKRFLRMQNHSGEHIVSGIVHSEYGYENVGFHLDDGLVTVDFNGKLTRPQLDNIEDEANRIIYENRKIITYFPDSSDLSSLQYRSKLDLTENVRLVEIEGVDLCACCAPHVALTGEIGLIKILDFSRHRGGTRLFLKCGMWALYDYRNKYENVLEISNLLSVKKEEAASGVERLMNELYSERQRFSDYKLSIVNADKELLAVDNDNVVFFSESYDSDMLREIVNYGKALCKGVSAAFNGNDENGYSYVASSNNVDMNNFSKNMNIALFGKGGGRDNMIQGKLTATKAEITAFFNK